MLGSFKFHSEIKILSVLGADEYLKRLEGKIKSADSFMLKYSKITVVVGCQRE